MKAYVARRLLRALGVAAGIGVLSFLLLHVRPDDAARVLADRQGLHGEAGLEAVRERHGLDRPLSTQLLAWVGGIVRGDLGDSWSRPGSSVGAVLSGHLPRTLSLTAAGLLLELLLGVLIAGFCLRHRGSWRDGLVTGSATALHSMPEFCLGLLLAWPLALELRWFPRSGARSTPWEADGAADLAGFLDALHHLALPALCLGLGGAALVANLLRTRWEEELGSRWVTGVRARGLSPNRIVWGHALRAAAGPLCTAVGLSLPALVGGAVILEQVFDWPGLGRVLVQAVGFRDLPLVAGANLVLAALVALGGLVSDLLWLTLDPRARPR